MTKKNKRQKTQPTKIKSDREDITTRHHYSSYRNMRDYQREFYVQSCGNKLDNLDKVDKYIKTHQLLKLT